MRVVALLQELITALSKEGCYENISGYRQERERALTTRLLAASGPTQQVQ